MPQLISITNIKDIPSLNASFHFKEGYSTGKKLGLKPGGRISSIETATNYITLVEPISEPFQPATIG